MEKLTAIALGLLLMLGTISTAHSDTGANTDASKTPTALAVFSLKDQHSNSHTLNADVKRIYYTCDMAGGKLMKKVFGVDGQKIIDGTTTIAISNVSGMNGFIRNNMALPALKKRPFTIWIDDSGVSNALPYKEDHVSVIDLTGMKITSTRFISEQQALRELAGLSTP